MKTKIYLLLLLFVPHILLPTPPPTSKTFFKSSNAPLWFSPSALPFNQTKKHTNATLQSALGVEGFYWHSTAKTQLGNYFGFYDSTSEAAYPFIRVTADVTIPHSLTPQDIVHNSANAGDPFNPTTNKMRATLNFKPHIEQFGLIMTNSVCINKWITIHTIMPWMQTRHVLGLTTTGAVNDTVENNQKGILDFFAGNLHQETAASPDQQDALRYGLLTNAQSVSGLADITMLCLIAPEVHEDIKLQVGFLAALPTTSRPNGIYLFEPTLGSGSHPLFGLYGRAETDFFTYRTLTVGGSIDATVRAGITSQEVRSPSFLIGDNDAAFERYALGGKKNARRLFPLINILTQVVGIKPGANVEVNIGINAGYKRVSGGIEYRFTHTGAEKVSPIFPWPSNTYALSELFYAQTTVSGPTTTYHTFSIADDSAFSGSAPLTDRAIYFDAAATPAQTTHSFLFSVRCTPLPQFPYSSLQVRGSYSFTGSTIFGVGGYGISCALCHTF
ncbi:MAG: hypothetical protein QG604_120 [Candidatus Dependentiae bacterium]|nr:hypothetical protein [Candidatus Dependentiae bacterium]